VEPSWQLKIVTARVLDENETIKFNPTPGFYFAVSSNGERKAVKKFVMIK